MQPLTQRQVPTRPPTRPRLGHRTSPRGSRTSASTSARPRPEIRRMSARSQPCEQVHLPWVHAYGEGLIIHGEASDEDNEDDEDEHDDGDDNHNKQDCRDCKNFVHHFRANNGIPGSLDEAELDLRRWYHEHPFEDSLGTKELTAELSAKSSEAEHLRTQLNVTKTSLDAKDQRIIALLEENHCLKASRQEEDLQRDRLRKNLMDQQKRREVLTERIVEVQARQGHCHRALVDTRRELDNTRRELDNTRRELDNTRRDLENALQRLAQIPPPPPRPIEDASTSSPVAMSPGPSQSQVWIVLSP